MLAALIASGLGALPATAQVISVPPDVGTYSVTDLGTLTGGPSIALAINDSGQVAGFANTSIGTQHAFLWSNGVIQDLGTFGGTNSRAQAINAAGHVVGWSNTAHNGTTCAFLYSGGTLADLVLPPGAFDLSGGDLVNLASPAYAFSEANGINGAGEVVGWWDSPVSGPHRPFLESGGVVQDLLPVDSNTFPVGAMGEATATNDGGQVVGWTRIAGENERAYLYQGGVVQHLGTLGGSFSIALGINSVGQVVGYSRNGGGADHAFLFTAGAMLDLGTLGSDFNFSRANGINDSGQVVGYSDRLDGTAHAFLYGGGVMEDLNSLIPADSGWGLEAAYGINDAGQIVGVGSIRGEEHAFLLSPSLAPQQSPVTSSSSGM